MYRSLGAFQAGSEAGSDATDAQKSRIMEERVIPMREFSASSGSASVLSNLPKWAIPAGAALIALILLKLRK